MINWLRDFFSKGPKNTIALKGGANFSYNGPWQKLAASPLVTRLDRWHLGDFSSAEYTIVADFDTSNREIVKCTVVAGTGKADLTIYGRSNLGTPILAINITVNNSYVDVNVEPSSEDSTDMSGAKVFFSATYFKAVNPPV